MFTNKLYSSAPHEPNTNVEQRLEKIIRDNNSFDNSINNLRKDYILQT